MRLLLPGTSGCGDEVMQPTSGGIDDVEWPEVEVGIVTKETFRIPGHRVGIGTEALHVLVLGLCVGAVPEPEMQLRQTIRTRILDVANKVRCQLRFYHCRSFYSAVTTNVAFDSNLDVVHNEVLRPPRRRRPADRPVLANSCMSRSTSPARSPVLVDHSELLIVYIRGWTPPRWSVAGQSTVRRNIMPIRSHTANERGFEDCGREQISDNPRVVKPSRSAACAPSLASP